LLLLLFTNYYPTTKLLLAYINRLLVPLNFFLFGELTGPKTGAPFPGTGTGKPFGTLFLPTPGYTPFPFYPVFPGTEPGFPRDFLFRAFPWFLYPSFPFHRAFSFSFFPNRGLFGPFLLNETPFGFGNPFLSNTWAGFLNGPSFFTEPQRNPLGLNFFGLSLNTNLLNFGAFSFPFFKKGFPPQGLLGFWF